MLGLMGMVLALLLLIYFAYRGFSVLLLTPIMATIAALFTLETPLLATYTQIFMPKMGSFVILYFPLFLLGALFGKLMDDSGAAEAIASKIITMLGAKHVTLAIVLACAILTYGGVSLFVVAFAIYPIAMVLFKKADIPKRLIPATIGLGAFTFTMTALPGTPAIQNSIPMPYFGTTSFAAPILGLIAAFIMFSLGQIWLSWQVKRAEVKQEGYGHHPDAIIKADLEMRMQSQEQGFDLSEISPIKAKSSNLPSFIIAIIPIIAVISLNYLFSTNILPRIDSSYLATTLYGQTEISKVLGIWSLICSLTSACLILITLNRKNFKNLRHSLDSGASASVLPIFNTASLVGFGAVIASFPAFELLKDSLSHMEGNPLVSLAISVNILAGITGSASGGATIALQALGESYMLAAQKFNISPELLHRITTIATGGLDSLPHNGAVVTLLGICNLKHKEAYKDLFIVAVLSPLVALVTVLILGSHFGAF